MLYPGTPVMYLKHGQEVCPTLVMLAFRSPPLRFNPIVGYLEGGSLVPLPQ